MAHYDDESLFEYVEGTSPIASEIEVHVSSCAECAIEVGDHRELISHLGEKDVWEEKTPPVAPRQFLLNVTAFAERARAEEEGAAILCEEILTGPSTWWPQRLRKMQGARNAGMGRTSGKKPGRYSGSASSSIRTAPSRSPRACSTPAMAVYQR